MFTNELNISGVGSMWFWNGIGFFTTGNGVDTVLEFLKKYRDISKLNNENDVGILPAIEPSAMKAPDGLSAQQGAQGLSLVFAVIVNGKDIPADTEILDPHIQIGCRLFNIP